MRKILSTILVVMLLAFLLPNVTLAEDYGIWVQGIRVTDDNKNDVLEDGTVRYDPASSTLTLDGATIAAAGTGNVNDPATHGIYAAQDIRIALSGTNTITVTGNSGCGIYAYSNFVTHNVTVSGGGSLDIESLRQALLGKDVTFKSDCGTITATASNDDAIRSTGRLTIEGGNISATTTRNGYYSGFNVTGDIAVTGGHITARSTGSGDGSRGFYSSGGSINFSGGTITASGNDTAVCAYNGSFNLLDDYATPSNRTVYVGADAPETEWTGTNANTELNNQYKYISITPVISASVGNVTISGTTGTAITDTDVTLTLIGDRFKPLGLNENVSDWFNLPANLFAKIKEAVTAGANSATVTIYGTPTAESTAAMAITIPAASLTGGTAIVATPNTDAKYSIAAPAPVVPAITDPVQAETVTATAGSPATLDVTAANATGYQWYIDRGDGNGWQAITGANAASYTTSAVTMSNSGYRYFCRISNANGSIDSPVFTLSVTEQPDIPATGDSATPGLWIGFIMLTGIGLLASAALRRRKRHSN